MEILSASDISRLKEYIEIPFLRISEFEKIQLNELSQQLITQSHDESKCFNYNGNKIFFEYLGWDSNFFGFPCYKIQFISGINFSDVLNEWMLKKTNPQKSHVYIQVPSSDISCVQSLSQCGFSLIETRLNYFQDLRNFSFEKRYPVRFAEEADTKSIGIIARKMRNIYDRFHADPALQIKADDFLERYASESVKGFADWVLIPNDPAIHSHSFLTAKLLKSHWEKWGIPISKMVLSAVDSDTNKGWYKKLITEMSIRLFEEGAHYAYMNTQSTNKAVIHVWENLGYRYGSSDYIFSKTF